MNRKRREVGIRAKIKLRDEALRAAPGFGLLKPGNVQRHEGLSQAVSKLLAGQLTNRQRKRLAPGVSLPGN